MPVAYATSSRSAALEASFDFGTSTGYCSTSVTLKKNSGKQMTYFSYCVLLLIGIAAIVAGSARIRKVATLQLGERDDITSHFKMMPNEATYL